MPEVFGDLSFTYVATSFPPLGIVTSPNPLVRSFEETTLPAVSGDLSFAVVDTSFPPLGPVTNDFLRALSFHFLRGYYIALGIRGCEL
jgi:hypothetical protein